MYRFCITTDAKLWDSSSHLYCSVLILRALLKTKHHRSELNEKSVLFLPCTWLETSKFCASAPWCPATCWHAERPKCAHSCQTWLLHNLSSRVQRLAESGTGHPCSINLCISDVDCVVSHLWVWGLKEEGLGSLRIANKLENNIRAFQRQKENATGWTINQDFYQKIYRMSDIEDVQRTEEYWVIVNSLRSPTQQKVNRGTKKTGHKLLSDMVYVIEKIAGTTGVSRHLNPQLFKVIGKHPTDFLTGYNLNIGWMSISQRTTVAHWFTRWS